MIYLTICEECVMLYPISSNGKNNNIVFGKKIVRQFVTPNATVNYKYMQNVNMMKSAYLETINRVSQNNVLLAKFKQEFQNIRIEDNVLTILGEDNKSVKFSMIEIDLRKIFRIKFFDNKELVNMITLDNDRLVKRLDKKNIEYATTDIVDMNQVNSTIETIANAVDLPLLNIRRFLRNPELAFDRTKIQEPIRFEIPKSVQELKDKGITPTELPLAKTSKESSKAPLFSYAQLISNSKKEMVEKAASKPVERVKRGNRAKKPLVTTVVLKKTVAPKASSVESKSSINKPIGILPSEIAEKLSEVQALYKEMYDIFKSMSISKAMMIKKSSNLAQTRAKGLDFINEAGQRVSLSTPQLPRFSERNLFRIKVLENNFPDIVEIFDNNKRVVQNVANDTIQEKNIRYKNSESVAKIANNERFVEALNFAKEELIKLKDFVENKKWRKPKGLAKKVAQEKTIKAKTFVHVKPEVLSELESLWQNLKTIDENAKKLKILKSNIAMFQTGKAIKDYRFITPDGLLMFGMLSNRFGNFYKITKVVDAKIISSHIISTDGRIVATPNAKTGGLAQYVAYSRESNFDKEIFNVIDEEIKTLKDYTDKYQSAVENVVVVKPKLGRKSKSKINKKMDFNHEQVKQIMEKAMSDLDSAIATIKKEFGVIKLFNKTVNDIKKSFQKFLDETKQN